MPARHPFRDLVDVPALQELTDELYTATGIPSAIITTDGEVLTGSGWQRVCTEFHRRHPEIERDCITSDTAIRQAMADGEEFAIYECPRGLVDACSPVVIEGEHVANVFAGQLFMTSPDEAKEAFFRVTARRYGLDEEAYLEAYREIPVLPEGKFRPALRFLSRFAKLVASIGLARRREMAAMDEVVTNERKYLRLLQLTSTVPWEVDLSRGGFTYVGPQAERILGYPPSHWRTLDDWAATVHEADREWARRLCEAETAAGRDHELTYRMVARDGRTVWVHNVLTVVGGSSGPEKLIGFLHDVTEQKEAAARREAMEAMLRQSQKMEAIGTLAGGIAHDFNNILAAVLGYAELTLPACQEGSTQRENLQQIIVASERAKVLIKQILKFSRRGEEEKRPVEPAQIVAEAMSLLRSTIPTTIDFVLDIDSDAGFVLGESSQLHQVVMNLCTNAYHAMRRGSGTITLGVKGAEVSAEAAAGIEGLRPGRYVKIVVADTGKGMDRQTLGRIFDPYFTTKGLGEGTGLGLAVVRGVVSGHGGAISVESAPGVGTTFAVYLPKVSERPAASATAQAEALEGEGSILFVDDDPVLAELGKAMLEGLGYTVREMTDPLEALHVFEDAPEAFDLIVTDQTMPGLTGAELVRRALAVRPGLPTVICSGYSDILDEVGAKMIGARAFTMKPYSRTVLASVVRKALGGTSSAP